MLVRTHNDLDRQGQGQGQGHVTYLGQSRGMRPLIILTGQDQVKVKVKVKGRQVHFFDISTPKSRSDGKKYIFVISKSRPRSRSKVKDIECINDSHQT